MIFDLSSTGVMELAEKILEGGSAVHCRCRGHSMSPLVCDGEVAVVRWIDPDDCRIGDVVLASRGDRILLHRIAQIRASRTIVTGGDNQERHDREIGSLHILGKLSSVITGKGAIDFTSVRGKLLDLLSRHSGRLRHSRAHPKRIMGGWLYRLAFLVRRT